MGKQWKRLKMYAVLVVLKDCLESTFVYGKIMLKTNLMNSGGRLWTEFVRLSMETYICRSVVNVVISAQVPYEKEEFLSGFTTVRFVKALRFTGINKYLFLF
jgi:hypothetical protein